MAKEYVHCKINETLHRNVDQPLPQDPVYNGTQCGTCTLQKILII